ncbi:hypothetical protein PUNSTDRAFT_133335 [Punctularia strigosozonata HHB-11173 SS5]|uniref:uncharacterized protein n=1 Tax=Punctularia strigosozonata (strain HHB-11173) TaxID=741275 RepID=UPI000441647B|nr:uncharacterized protein PUNSTDRAFT_133335 [Punctularia strigosozonata HHB-11173 SS5]EIN09550.1 hypothetical protein PUNSTDRAFT_133335 [Punctularia strigosozonata HHB-11173 SS5]
MAAVGADYRSVVKYEDVVEEGMFKSYSARAGKPWTERDGIELRKALMKAVKAKYMIHDVRQHTVKFTRAGISRCKLVIEKMRPSNRNGKWMKTLCDHIRNDFLLPVDMSPKKAKEYAIKAQVELMDYEERDEETTERDDAVTTSPSPLSLARTETQCRTPRAVPSLAYATPESNPRLQRAALTRVPTQTFTPPPDGSPSPLVRDRSLPDGHDDDSMDVDHHSVGSGSVLPMPAFTSAEVVRCDGAPPPCDNCSSIQSALDNQSQQIDELRREHSEKDRKIARYTQDLRQTEMRVQELEKKLNVVDEQLVKLQPDTPGIISIITRFLERRKIADDTDAAREAEIQRLTHEREDVCRQLEEAHATIEKWKKWKIRVFSEPDP